MLWLFELEQVKYEKKEEYCKVYFVDVLWLGTFFGFDFGTANFKIYIGWATNNKLYVRLHYFYLLIYFMFQRVILYFCQLHKSLSAL